MEEAELGVDDRYPDDEDDDGVAEEGAALVFLNAEMGSKFEKEEGSAGDCIN